MSDLRITNWAGAKRVALSESDLDDFCAVRSGWSVTDAALQKTYRFNNYFETMAFANAVAMLAHTWDHHPDMALSYNRATVRWNTHDVGGISASDTACALACDQLLMASAP